MTVVCINDKGKPAEIPNSQWIKKDEKYTVIELVKCNAQGGLLGYKLAEISLEDCVPYICFAANRFVPLSEIIDKEVWEEESILI